MAAQTYYHDPSRHSSVSGAPPPPYSSLPPGQAPSSSQQSQYPMEKVDYNRPDVSAYGRRHSHNSAVKPIDREPYQQHGYAHAQYANPQVSSNDGVQQYYGHPTPPATYHTGGNVGYSGPNAFQPRYNEPSRPQYLSATHVPQSAYLSPSVAQGRPSSHPSHRPHRPHSMPPDPSNPRPRRGSKSKEARDTFFGAGAGAILGDVLLGPGIGTAAVALLGGVGANRHAKQKERTRREQQVWTNRHGRRHDDYD